MDITFPKPGAYVVAVSGGVDSIVLLNLLHNKPGLKLTVAHFDHGIRPDSKDDRRFVQQLAERNKIPFVYDEGHLGSGASEAKARAARYAFLRRVQQACEAQALITAHHQDDALETSILNMLRGTGRKGLTSLQSHIDLQRPLLKVPKNTLIDYAKKRELKWHEDSSNGDLSYLRNYVRQEILPRFNRTEKEKLVSIVTNLEVTNTLLDNTLAELLATQAQGKIDRQWFNQLPHVVSKEIMAAWLRENGIRDFDRSALERLVVASKTAAAGKTFPVTAAVKLNVNKDSLALAGAER